MVFELMRCEPAVEAEKSVETTPFRVASVLMVLLALEVPVSIE